MKTVEEMLIIIKRIAIGFLVAGIAMAVFIIIITPTSEPEEDEINPYSFYNTLSAKEYALKRMYKYLKADHFESPKFLSRVIYDDCIACYDYKTQKYGLVDNNGNWIVEPVCSDVKQYHSYYTDNFVDEEIVRLKNGDSEALVDKKGNWYLEPGVFYQTISFRNYGISFSEYNNGLHWGLRDYEGNTILEPKYEDFSVFPEDNVIFATVREGEYRLLDMKGNEILDGERDYIEYTYSSEPDKKLFFIVCDENRKYYTCDVNGKDILPHDYDRLEAVGNGIMLAEIDGKEGFIDENGNEVLEICYKDIREIATEDSNDKTKKAFLVTAMDDKEGFYTLDGGFIVEPQEKISLKNDYYYDSRSDTVYFHDADDNLVVFTREKESENQ